MLLSLLGVEVEVSMVVDVKGDLTTSLGAARAASWAANLAASFLRTEGSEATISLFIALSLFSLLHLIDFAIFLFFYFVQSLFLLRLMIPSMVKKVADV